MGERKDYKHGEFCWVDILAKDANTLKKFYSELFGWKAELEKGSNPEYYFFKKNEKKLCGLVQMPAMLRFIGISTAWNSYVCVDNVDKIVEKTRSLGGSVALPPMDVMSAGRAAFLKDPQGVTFGVWEKKEVFGAEIRNEDNVWSWNELITLDHKSAQKFYGQLFGWTFKSVNDDPHNLYIVIEDSGSMCGGIRVSPSGLGDHSPSWHVYFTVNDLSGSLEKVKTLGGKVNIPPFPIGVGDIAVASDPEGGLFHLINVNFG